jgi:hypothetical protein
VSPGRSLSGTQVIFEVEPNVAPNLIFGLNVCAPQLTVIGVLVVGCLFLSVAAVAQASPILPNNEKWRLTWSDDLINGPDGSGVDSSKWVEVGAKGWGDQELDYYTSRRENAHIQDGNLVIEARRRTTREPTV